MPLYTINGQEKIISRLAVYTIRKSLSGNVDVLRGILNQQLQNPGLQLLPAKGNPNVMRWQNPNATATQGATKTPAPQQDFKDKKVQDVLFDILDQMGIEMSQLGDFQRGDQDFNVMIKGGTSEINEALKSIGGTFGRGEKSNWFFNVDSREELASKLVVAIGDMGITGVESSDKTQETDDTSDTSKVKETPEATEKKAGQEDKAAERQDTYKESVKREKAPGIKQRQESKQEEASAKAEEREEDADNKPKSEDKKALAKLEAEDKAAAKAAKSNAK